MQLWGRQRMRRRGIAAAVTALAGLGPTVGGAQDPGGRPPGQTIEEVKAGLERELLATGRFYTRQTDRLGDNAYTAHDIEHVELTACRLQIRARSRAYQPATDTSRALIPFQVRAVSLQTIAMADVDPDAITSWQVPPAAGRFSTPIEVRRLVYVRLQTASGHSAAFRTESDGRRGRSQRVSDLAVRDLEAAARVAEVIKEAVVRCRELNR
jgi:hypothetical protein